ncbi:MAG TPA: hypothetical protein EYH45_03270 [Candidatus Caldiarchaeum subterraneum]|uniref:Uncharacterized protein n=1 Tax=Caldiarchaeum subterraneum TaxID=311458 RepID=A0A833E9U2_CALS0|nr:hypothetical protein [Aigarchaeota archaeon]HIQ29564.1 hypothetical protein [Candidatus Caldarchaeum subterraneum]
MGEKDSNFFPADARLEMVLGLVEIVASSGNRIEIAKISQDLQTDVDRILPVVEAAEKLEFIKVVDGECEVTETGLKALSSRSNDQKKVIRDKIVYLEPFATALRLAEERPEGFTAEDVAERLSGVRGGNIYVEDPEKLHQLLVEWLLYTEMLDYDGDNRRFKKFT